jgi:heterodisulfide reductase subunit B
MSYLYYPGCTLSTTAKFLDSCARRVSAHLDITLENVTDWQCCGAVYSSNPEQIAQKLPAMRILQQARDKGKTLVTLCSACHNVLKQTNHLAKNDQEFQATVSKYEPGINYQGEARVIHFLELLRDTVTFEQLKKSVVNPLKGRTFAAYYGCLLLRPAEIMNFDDPENPQIFENMLRALGARVATFPMRNECCGGYQAIEDSETCAEYVNRIIESALSRGVDTLVTACPLCQFQLIEHAAGRLDVSYFTEILAEALGVDDDE